MERILVSMSSRQGAWEAWSRAISLAKRIDAKVYALLVQPPHAPGRGGRREHEEAGVQKRLELLIELAKSEGIPIDYFISDGTFEDEVVQFADLNKITLLVAEFPDGDHRHPAREEVAIHKIRHRVRCRVELVSPRETQP